MMGSMGSVVGEKVCQAFETAMRKKLAVVAFTASGGARMQEGPMSLLQMVKTAGVVKKHSDKGLLYVSVITDPTTGGVSASFASLADIIIAEPHAIFGFTGKRIIQDTRKRELPEDFQTAESALKNGAIDMVVERGELKSELAAIFSLHGVWKHEYSEYIGKVKNRTEPLPAECN
jgi:acetyl-CoA carboxylase carboxyl transferase subunit beta